MGGAGGLFEGGDLVVEGVPFAVEDVGAGDDDVDFTGAGGYRPADLFDPGFERREAGGEAGGDGGDGDAGAFEGFHGRLDEGVVDTDGARLKMEAFDAKGFDDMVLERAAGLGAETADAVGGVVAREGGEVHASDGAEEPGSLPIFLDAATGGNGGGATLHCAGVDADFFYPVEVEGDAAVGA